MIITHAQNAAGERRIYLGGKGSLECWISPKPDQRGWTFHIEEAVTGNQLSDAEKKAWAIHTLFRLAQELDVAPHQLRAVPFEAIAALHTADPFAGHRIAVPKRKIAEQCFMSAPPSITRPKADFASQEYSQDAGRRR